MAQHIRESVMAAFVTQITGLTTVGTNVYRQRSYNFETSKLPSYNVLQGEEEPRVDEDEGAVLSFTDRELLVTVELRARGITTPETTINLMESELVAALMADRRLGLGAGIMHDIKESTTGEIVDSVEGDQPVAMIEKLFRVQYRTSGADPGA